MITCQARNEQSRGGLDRGGMWNGTQMLMTPLERALVRLLATGYRLEEAASSLGLSAGEARALLDEIQGRAGVPNETRLIVLAVLNAWV